MNVHALKDVQPYEIVRWENMNGREAGCPSIPGTLSGTRRRHTAISCCRPLITLKHSGKILSRVESSGVNHQKPGFDRPKIEIGQVDISGKMSGRHVTAPTCAFGCRLGVRP